MKPLDRRAFLKGVAAMSAMTAGTALTVAPFESTDGQIDPRVDPAWKKAPCRLCGVGCGLLIGIENGTAGAVKGDPDASVNKGLACAKGYYSVQALFGRDRISRAMVRSGGRLLPVPLSQALDLVANRLRETIRDHGKDSVAIYGSSQWTSADAFAASMLFKTGLGSDNVETSRRIHAASAVAGLETTFGREGSLGCYEDIDHADTFVLWDTNLAETDPVLFSRMLERRRKDPAVRIIDLTRRTTRTSYAADASLVHAPHSALAIANTICRELIEKKLVDRDFIDRYVGFRRGRTDIGHGVSSDDLVNDQPVEVKWNEFARFISDSTPEKAQRISGIPADRIRWLATVYGDRTRKVMSVWGRNINGSSRGTWTNNAIYNIHLLTGKIGTPGNSAFATSGQPGGDDPGERATRRGKRHAIALFRGLERGDVRFLWIQATNPMLSLPNAGRYRAAAARPDRFVVVSEAYPTPTTDVADVVLPSAIWLEREGVFVNAERRAQHFAAMQAPPGDALPDAMQLIEVAKRLGLSSHFPVDTDNYAEKLWQEYRQLHNDRTTSLPTFAELRSSPGALWPDAGGNQTKWRYNTSLDPAANRSRGAFDFYGNPDHRAWIWLRPYDTPAESLDAAHPFWLSTGAVLEHWGGGAMTQRIPTLHRAAPRAYLEMNHDDAKRLGVKNGDTVRVSSRRASMVIEARVDYRSQLPPGQVFIPSFDEGHPVQKLMLDAFCPLSGQPDSTTCAVSIERTAARNTP
jgi:nitrate reductase NapA